MRKYMIENLIILKVSFCYPMNFSWKWLHEFTSGEHCQVVNLLGQFVLLSYKKGVTIQKNLLEILKETYETTLW